MDYTFEDQEYSDKDWVTDMCKEYDGECKECPAKHECIASDSRG